MASAGKFAKKSIDQAIKDKMRCLDDFYICDRYDPEMIAKLKQIVAEHPDKDPREVLDYYCRGMIKAKVKSWGD